MGSFTGIPWTTSSIIQTGPYNSFGQYFPNAVVDTEPTPAAAVAGEIQGLAGMLQGSGRGAISAAAAGNKGVYGEAKRLNKEGNLLNTLGGQTANLFNFNLPYAQEALRDAFDPMNAQYKYYLQQQNDAIGAQEAATGLAGTPYAAASTGAADAAFNNQWQMQKLQREQLGEQTAAGLEAPVLGAHTAAGQMYSAAGQLFNDAGQLQLGAVQNMLQAYGLQGQDLSNAMNALVGLLNASRVTISGGGGGGGGSGGGGLGMSFDQGSGSGALGGGV